MDPLTVFGAVANAVQFVDFAWKVISGTHEIYQSATGTTKEQQALRHLTQSLQRINDSLVFSAQNQTRKNGPNDAESDLSGLLTECSSVAVDILTKLNGLKLDPQGSNRKWASLLQYVRSRWAKPELEALESRLNAFRQQISMHLLVSIR